MSTLQARLDRIREQFRSQAPAEALEVMHRATDDLRNSGILDGIPKVGSALPSFDLSDSEGAPASSHELLGDGPLVITFYRGLW